MLKNAIETSRIETSRLKRPKKKIHIKSERGLYKKYTDPVVVFKMVSTANISDAMHRCGNMKGIMQVSGAAAMAPSNQDESGLAKSKLIGQAITVRTYPGDWAKPVEAIDMAKKGDVIVIDAGGTGNAVWGELASLSCKNKDICGVVIDGAIRDLAEIKMMKFHAFSREVKSTAGEPRGFGEINVPIRCGGILVRQGDYIIGDMDGVVVVPKERAIDIANRALDIFEKENRIRSEIKKGGTLSKILEIKKWERVL